MSWPLGLVATACALAMAFDRVYVGAHYPLDVIAGAVLGLLWSAVFLRLDPVLAIPYAATIGFARRLHLA